jgi:methionyl-tRNA formyltransferase
MKLAVIGGVLSTRLLVEKLHQHGFREVHVFGYAPASTELVSGWEDLAPVAARLGYPHTPFVKVVSCTEALRQLAPQLIFAVGLSQLIPPEILDLPEHGCIGFHPTALPTGRGRGPIPWLVLERGQGAASFFVLRDGVDDGPIVVQEHYPVYPDDDARSLCERLGGAIGQALDRWLPRLAQGDFTAVEQDHTRATWFGRRTPDDGWLDWQRPAEELLRLIRASTEPYPGAYSFAGPHKVTIWRAELETEHRETGVVGRLLKVWDNGHFCLQCGIGLLRVTHWTCGGKWQPRVGERLGYYVEAELHALRRQNADLEKRLIRLERALEGTLTPPPPPSPTGAP